MVIDHCLLSIRSHAEQIRYPELMVIDHCLLSIRSRAGSIEKIFKLGQSKPEDVTREWIPKEEAMWFATPVFQHLNGIPADPDEEAESASACDKMEANFERLLKEQIGQ